MNLDIMGDASERIRYENPAVPILAFRGNLHALSGMSALCHWRPEVELILPIEGRLSYMVDGKKIRIDAGRALFVNTRRMHYGYSEDGTDCDYLCAVFDPLMLSGNEEIKSRYILPILSNADFNFLLIERREFSDMLRNLDSEWNSHSPDRELAATERLLQIWRFLWGQTDTESGAFPANENARILRKMLAHIRLHYKGRLSLQNIAAAGGVCRSNCCRLFKTYLQQTPNDYLNSLRMEQAAKLLRETELSVTEIALSCDFHSGSYFTELFSRRKNCTPTAFRQQYGTTI